MAKKWLVVAGWMAVILVLSTRQVKADYGATLPNLVHFVEYGILAVLVRIALTGATGLGAFALDVLALSWAAIYGVLMEVTQMFVPTRTADINDAMVNAFGALVALVAARIVVLARRKAE